ncbi:MAG: hypothetical protein II703_05415 [Ruminococcus sp.]|nr:hypothetical protein [Ruminococcus sp.]
MSKTIRVIVTIILGICAITFVILSMVMDKVTPYLGISLCCSAVANIMNCRWKKEGYNFCKENSSLEE